MNILSIALAAFLSACSISPKDLSTTVDTRFSWIPAPRTANTTGESQTAWQIILKDESGRLVWDSGKVASEENHLVEYDGPALEQQSVYTWKVKLWDSRDKASRWSREQTLYTGVDPDSWGAEWIGAPWHDELPTLEKTPAPNFRKEFEVKGRVVSATAYVCGLGWFEMYLNGKRVSDDYFVPAFTDYTRRFGLEKRNLALFNNFRSYRTLYMTYDVTDFVRRGGNAAGILLGGGYFDSDHKHKKIHVYGTPRAICRIVIRYSDGTIQTVVTDESWKVANSPIVMNDLYDGEIYDARLEQKDWAKAGYDDSDWAQAVLMKAPEGELAMNDAPADRIQESIAPVSFEKQEDGSYKADFGKVISGWIRLEDLKGAEGDTVRIFYPSEEPNGTVEYIMKGAKRGESYATRFTWFVFREAIISGIDDLDPRQVRAEAVNSDVAVTSTFECDNELFGNINEIWRRTQLDNMHSGVASDCPHRERLAYTGDGEIAIGTVMANFDVEDFYRKWIEDVRVAQDTLTGYVPNGTPWEPYCGGGPAWGAAISIMPWEFYCQYGDTKILKDNLFAMTEYIRYLRTWLTPEGTILSKKLRVGTDQPHKYFNLGDWAVPFDLPEAELVHTFYLWTCEDLTSKAAAVLGDTETAETYEALAEETWNAFHSKLYDPETKSYGDYGSNVYALRMGVPADRHEDVCATLRDEIANRYGGHINCGFVAARHFFEVLADNGMNDLAYGAMDKRDFPSFGNWIELGATTFWEYFDGIKSRVHPMYGGGLTWFYTRLAGLQTDPAAPGFRHFTVAPVPCEGLSRVKYSTKTVRGDVSVEVLYGDECTIEVAVPVGCKATVKFPEQYGGREEEVGQGRHILRQ